MQKPLVPVISDMFILWKNVDRNDSRDWIIISCLREVFRHLLGVLKEMRRHTTDDEMIVLVREETCRICFWKNSNGRSAYIIALLKTEIVLNYSNSESIWPALHINQSFKKCNRFVLLCACVVECAEEAWRVHKNHLTIFSSACLDFLCILC